MFGKVLAFTFVAIAAAQTTNFQILAPGPDIWWVANNINNIIWTPCDGTAPATAFNVLVSAPSSVAPGLVNLSLLGNQPTFQCSKSFTPTNLPVGKGYTMTFTEATDTTKVLASTTFEVRDSGAAYPTTTAESATGTAASTGSAASTGASAQASTTGGTNSTTSGSSKSGAVSLAVSGGVAALGFAGALAALV